MEETDISEIPALDLGRLGEQLYQFLLSDAIATSPLQVNCSLSEETLIIIIQYSETLKLQKACHLFLCPRIFRSSRSFIFISYRDLSNERGTIVFSAKWNG